MPRSLHPRARLTRKLRYLVFLMKDTIPDHKLQKAVDILEQCSLALKFYVGTREPKYLHELEWSVKRLHQLLSERGQNA